MQTVTALSLYGHDEPQMLGLLLLRNLLRTRRVVRRDGLTADKDR